MNAVAVFSLFVGQGVCWGNGDERGALVRLLESARIDLIEPESFAQVLKLREKDIGSIFASHHDRRRSNDVNLPCESVDPLDTSDSDCATARWNKLVWFYPRHQSLAALENRIIQTESQVESFSSRIITGTHSNANSLFGAGGSLSKPSGTSGLNHNAFILSSASQQLQQATLAEVSYMYDSVANLAVNSIRDTQKLKDNLASAFSTLVASVRNASDRQAQSAFNNTDLMNSRATRSLQDAVDSVLTEQDSMSSVIASTIETGLAVQNTSASTASRLDNSLLDAADSVAALGDKLTSNAVTLKNRVSDSIAKMSTDLINFHSTSTNQLSSQANLIVADVQNEVQQQIVSSSSDWSNLSSAILNKTDDIGKNLSDQINSDLKANVTSSLANAANSLAATVQNGIDEVRISTQNSVRISQDSASAVSQLGDQVSSEVASVGSDTTQANSDNVHSVSVARQEAQNAIAQSMGISQESLDSLIEAIDQAQFDSSENIRNKANSRVSDVADLLSGLGESGSDAWKSFSTLSGVISSGKQKSDSIMRSDFDIVTNNVSFVGQNLLGEAQGVSSNLSSVSEALRDDRRVVSAKMTEIMSAGGSQVSGSKESMSRKMDSLRENLMNQISRDTSAHIDRVENRRAIAGSLLHAVSQSQKGASSIAELGSDYAEGDEQALSVLFSTLANNDDSVALTIGSEADRVRSDFNLSMAGGDVEKKNFLRLVKGFMEKIGAKKSNLNSEKFGNANSTLLKIEALKNQALAYDSESHLITSSAENGMAETQDQYRSKINELIFSFQNQDSDLTARFGPGLIHTVLDPALEFLNAYTAERDNNISNFVEKIRTSIGSMSSDLTRAMAQMKDLEQQLSIVATKTELASLLSSDLIDSENAYAKLANWHLGNVSRLNNTLMDMDSTASAGLLNVSAAIRLQIQALPANISASISATEDEFAAASSDLDYKIQKIRESLATAQSNEETENAVTALVVLTRLQALQKNVSSIDRQFRSAVDSESAKSIENSNRVSQSISGLLEGIRGFANDVEARNSEVQDSVKEVAQATSDLQFGYSLLLNSSIGSLTSSSVQAALNASALLSSVQNQVDRAAQSVVLTTSSLGNSSMGRLNSSFSEARDFRKLMSRAKSLAGYSNRSLAQKIAQILNEVESSSSGISNGANEGVSDILTRLQVVRHTMGSLLRLWNEFAFSMDRRTVSFQRSDSEFLSHLITDVSHELMSEESFANTSDKEIAKFNRLIESEGSGETETEIQIKSLANELKSILNRVNLQGSDTRKQLNAELNRIEDESNTENSQVLQTVKAELSNTVITGP